MEKHSAYCAMIRLGLKVPPTILVPYKNPIDNHRWTYTSEKYNVPFDLDVLAAETGYPLYMKPTAALARRQLGERPAGPALGVRRLRRDAHAPPGHRGLRAFRPSPIR